MTEVALSGRIDLGAEVTAQQYIATQEGRRDRIRRTEAAQGYDGGFCPAVPILAPEIQALLNSYEAFLKANGKQLRNTFLFDFLTFWILVRPVCRERLILLAQLGSFMLFNI